MSDWEKEPLHRLCYKLDEVCPPFWFTFSGTNKEGAIHVSTADHNVELAKFVVDENNSVDYVVTKILLQFSGGTIPA